MNTEHTRREISTVNDGVVQTKIARRHPPTHHIPRGRENRVPARYIPTGELFSAYVDRATGKIHLSPRGASGENRALDAQFAGDLEVLR